MIWGTELIGTSFVYRLTIIDRLAIVNFMAIFALKNNVRGPILIYNGEKLVNIETVVFWNWSIKPKPHQLESSMA